MRAVRSLHRLAPLVAFAAILTGAAPAAAQELFGTLRRETGAPAGGVVVLAERVSDGGVVARTVTGEQGTYRLRVSTDSLVVRALRIGQRPQVLGSFRLAAGAVQDVSAVLPEAPVTITALHTRVDTRCRVQPDGAETVARLFTEARTALLASQLVSLDGRPRTRYRIVTEQWNAREDSMEAVHTEEFTTDSLRPFQSVPVDSLIGQGYVVRELDGSMVYRAPDAEVLVDDRFLASYCLHLVEGTGDRAGWIGVGFRPARERRGITQVEGTLWLDRTTQALQRLEYGYVGLEQSVTRTNPGGWVTFTVLPNGVWFVSEWAIRMPRVSMHVTLRTGRGNEVTEVSDRQTVTGVQTVSGEVLEVMVNGRPRYTVGAMDRVDESGAVIGIAMDASLGPAQCTSGALVHGTVWTRSGTTLPGATVRWSWPASTGAAEERMARTDSAGRYQQCGIPFDQLVTTQVTAEHHEPVDIVLRVSPARTMSQVDLFLARRGPVTADELANPIVAPVAGVTDAIARAVPEWPGASSVSTSARSGVVLRVMDPERGPVPRAMVSVAGRTGQPADGDGHFALDDTTGLSLPVRVQRIGYRPYEGMLTRATSADPFVLVLEPLALESVRVEARPSAPAVRVVDADSIPIPYALVSVGGAQPSATDLTGHLRLPRSPGASIDIRVQRIGYVPFTGVVERAADGAFVITLHRLAQGLDTMRTVAARSTPLSRTGFYDRMRRVRQGAMVGEFLTPEELDLRIAGRRWWDVLQGKRYVTATATGLLGRGGCRMQVLLDGMPARGALDMLANGSEIMAIEVYPSTANAPSELIPVTDRGSCGIVAVWTGPRR